MIFGRKKRFSVGAVSAYERADRKFRREALAWDSLLQEELKPLPSSIKADNIMNGPFPALMS